MTYQNTTKWNRVGLQYNRPTIQQAFNIIDLQYSRPTIGLQCTGPTIQQAYNVIGLQCNIHQAHNKTGVQYNRPTVQQAYSTIDLQYKDLQYNGSTIQQAYNTIRHVIVPFTQWELLRHVSVAGWGRFRGPMQMNLVIIIIWLTAFCLFQPCFDFRSLISN